MGPTGMLRRYMDLFEKQAIQIHVEVEGYEGVCDLALGTPAFPLTFSMKTNDLSDRDAITDWVKAEIKTATGYDPNKFTWRQIHIPKTKPIYQGR